MFFDFNQIWIFSAVFRKRAYRRTDRHDEAKFYVIYTVHILNPLKPELNPICYLLALLGAHHSLHVSRIRVKLLTLR